MTIEHIAMYVNDLEAAKDFFVTYFGAVSNAGYHNTKTDFRSYFLTFDDGARLEIMTRPGLSNDAKAVARTGYTECRSKRTSTLIDAYPVYSTVRRTSPPG